MKIGIDPGNTAKKFKFLCFMLWDTIKEWKKHIFDKNLDEYHCCAGKREDECGCGGISQGEYIEDRYK